MAPLWAKFDVDMPVHPKLFEQRVWVRWLWFGLICIAKKQFADTGIIRGLSAAGLNRRLNLEVNDSEVRKALAYFEKIGMIRLSSDGAIAIKDFLVWNEPLDARDRSMMVYFIRDVGTGLIKIGTSKNPWARLAALRTTIPATKLEMVATISGSGFDAEADLHQRFSAARANGEWFKPTQDLLRFIRVNAKPARATGSSGSAATVVQVAPGEGEGELDQEQDRERGGDLEAPQTSRANSPSPSPSLALSGKSNGPEQLADLEADWPSRTLEKLRGAAAGEADWRKFLQGAAPFDQAVRVAAARKYLDVDRAKGKPLSYLVGTMRSMARDGAPAPEPRQLDDGEQERRLERERERKRQAELAAIPLPSPEERKAIVERAKAAAVREREERLAKASANGVHKA